MLEINRKRKLRKHYGNNPQIKKSQRTVSRRLKIRSSENTTMYLYDTYIINHYLKTHGLRFTIFLLLKLLANIIFYS